MEINRTIVKEDNVRIIADIMLKIDNDQKEIAVSSFVTPILKIGDNFVIGENNNPECMVY